MSGSALKSEVAFYDTIAFTGVLHDSNTLYNPNFDSLPPFSLSCGNGRHGYTNPWFLPGITREHNSRLLVQYANSLKSYVLKTDDGPSSLSIVYHSQHHSAPIFISPLSRNDLPR
jgi:hypothetical protein